MISVVDATWPPEMVKLTDWANGAGVAVLCGESDHRVVRQDGRLVHLDHPEIETEVRMARAALEGRQVHRLGFRYVDTGFNTAAMQRGIPRPRWIPPNPKAHDWAQGVVDEPDGLAPCVRLVIEGFVPCSWCGRLLADGSVCAADEDPYCCLANGNGWRRLIPPGWVHSKFAGIPLAFSRTWPHDYAWQRNSPLERHEARFLFSPWWPEVHPRRFTVLACQYRHDYGGTYTAAFQAVMEQLAGSLGDLRPPVKR